MRKLILTAFILFLLLAGTVHAAEVVLCWEPSIDAPYLDDKEAYKVYLTDSEGQYVLFSENQTENNLIGTIANHVLTFTAIVPDGDYQCWFVVTATDTRGLESVPSNEVSYIYNEPPPGPPQNLCICDCNGDGVVDGKDLALFAKEFGQTNCLKEVK